MNSTLLLQFIIYHLRATILLLLVMIGIRKIKVSAKYRYLLLFISMIILLLPFIPKIGNGVSISNTNSVVVNTISNISTESVNTVVTTTSEPRIDYQTMFLWSLVIVWIVGMLGYISQQTYRYIKFKKMINRWKIHVSEQEKMLFDEVKEELAITKNINIYKLEIIDSPMLVGLIKPIVLLLTYEVTDEELIWIIKHELTHYRHKDLWISLVCLIYNSVYWFNPLIHITTKYMQEIAEEYCDHDVILGENRETKIKYGELIISMIQLKPKYQVAVSTHFYSNKLSLKRRLKAIMDKKNFKKITYISAAFVAFGIILLGATRIFPLRAADIPVTQAKDIALQTAGLTGSDVQYTSEKLDGQVYEIKFVADGKEYEYDIDRNTGRVVKSEIKDLTTGQETTQVTQQASEQPTQTTTSTTQTQQTQTQPAPTSQPQAQPQSTQQSNIGAQRALNIALQDAGLSASNVTVIKNQLDTEDGILVYEVEFYTGNREYDYTIHATTGAILEKDYDVENFNLPTPSTTNLNFNQITGRSGNPKVEVDYENGQRVYEVTYYENGYEYQYEISEQGRILSYEVDRD